MRGRIRGDFPSREKALKDFFAEWEPKIEIEWVSISEALGRVTAKELRAINTLPVYRSSACDGIAVASSRFKKGVPDTSSWRLGREYERADTGDDFRDCYDAIIPIEEVDIAEDTSIQISPDVPVKAGWNVRPKGDTLKSGDFVIKAGMIIRPMDLASFAASGITRIPVRKRPKVAFIPTGNELIPAGIRPKRGQNVDTNSILIETSLMQMGAEPIIFPIIKDDPEALEEALRQAVARADFVILNGGTARGDEDYNFQLLERKGKLIHHYIAAAPGRPMAFAAIEGKPVVNLPGPTIAAYFGLEWCINAVVARCLGIPVPKRPTISCILEKEIQTKSNMAIMCLMKLTKTKNGKYHAYPQVFFEQSLTETLASNGLYISDLGETGRKKGEILEVELLRGEEYIEWEEENRKR